MNLFISTVAISFVPLHETALQIAKEIGPVQMHHDDKSTTLLM